MDPNSKEIISPIFFFFFFLIDTIKTRFESLAQKVDGLRPKKPKTMNLQRMGQKNQALMNQTNVKVDPDDKKMKLDRFVVKKIVIGTIRGDQFLYLSFRFDYKVSSRLQQCFSLRFPIPILIAPPPFIYPFPFFSLPSTCNPGQLILILVLSATSPNFQVVAIRLKSTIQISPPH